MADETVDGFDEERLLDVLRHCPAACAIARWRDRRFVEVNDAFTQLLGWTRDEIIGLTGAELKFVDSEVSTQLRSRLDGLLELSDQELAIRTRTGELRHVIIASDLVSLRGERHTITTFVDITARHQAQAAMSQLAAIIESSDDAIVSKDMNGIVRTWNRGAERIFGYAADEIVGTSIMRIIPPERADEEQYIMLKIAVGEGVTNMETKRRRKDGEIINVSITTSPVRDANGVIVGVSKIARDITEYHRSEQARRTSEVRYRALFESSPDGILLGERFKRYIDANPAICRMLGYTREELLNMRSSDVVVHAEIPRMEAALESITTQTIYRGAWELRRKDGTTFQAEVIGALLPDGIVMGLVRDITAQRRSEMRFRRLVDSNAQGVTFWKNDGAITEANDAFLRIIGHTRGELLSGLINWIDMTPPEYAGADEQCLSELSESGVCKPYEKEYIRGDGSRVSVLVGAAKLEDGPEHGVSFVVDLTDQKKLEQQFFRAQRMESVGTLAGGIAHDLNNVLAPILLSVGLLRNELVDVRQLALLETVQACAQRGADLVQQVLQFARGIEGRHMTVNPVHVLRDVLKVLRDTLPRSIEVRFDAPTDTWLVEGDPTQMHQMLLNLAVNARDAMPRGGRLTIALENALVDETYAGMNIDARPGKYVLFTVTDTGEGISAQMRERIFEPFFTTKEIGKGTGLGLSTSVSIVKSHGGFINVYSDAGQGAKFNVYWPAQEFDGAEAAEAAEAVTTSRLPRGNGELILVIDDEESVRSVARAALERFGYRVLLAANGAEAVAAFAVNRSEVAAVITDMAMPVMDGPATIIALKSLDPNAKIIATSGFATDEGLAQVEMAGVRDFVPKPYTADILLKTLHELLHPPHPPRDYV
ncbi:MAG TPA: PAS domain S-box protein [Gemmatimonadaceae bacterium]|jgi:PAS domain S-box-containing protein